MIATAEISMYPFNEEYKPRIKDFVTRLNGVDGLKVSTAATSTMIKGEYALVMQTLTELMAWSYETHGRSVFVTKIIPGYDGSF